MDELARAWDDVSDQWVAWARAADHDSYWQFHADALFELVPSPGKLTLDFGCGEGRVLRDLEARNHRVIGVDASPNMVAAARAASPRACVAVGDGQRLPVRTGVFDLVLAFMVLQDVDDLDAAVAEIARVLEPGGRLHLAIVHPLNSAGVFVPADGEQPPFVITESYLDRRRGADVVERDGLHMTFHHVHRPLHDYSDALADNGFVIERLAEVTDPGPTEKWHRVPLFLHIIARRD